MKIAMACDHAGFALKTEIAGWLREQGHQVEDFGTYDEQACDLPDFVYPAALAVARGECERGLFVDGVGYGSAMIANKLPGVFAAVAQDPFCAGLARSHSNTNVLCIGGQDHRLGAGDGGRPCVDDHRLPGPDRGEVRPAGRQGDRDRRAPRPSAVLTGTQIGPHSKEWSPIDRSEDQMARTPSAWGPLLPVTTVNSTRWPSSNDR